MDLEGAGESNKLVGSWRFVFRGSKGVRLTGAVIIAFIIGGCAIVPHQSQTSLRTSSASERDYLTQAVANVKAAPWPKPQQVSFISRMTGGGGEDRVTRSDAVEAYVDDIQHAADPVQKLKNDASANLIAADRLQDAAINALASSRHAMNDVILVEEAIIALRENGQIYVAAAKFLKKSGVLTDDSTIDVLREEYRSAVRQLGETADILAEQLEHDQSQTFATPKNFADL